MNKTNSNAQPPVEDQTNKISYTDLARGAHLFGIRAGVQLETRVLDAYMEMDPALGHNVVGAILSVLGHRVALNDVLGDGRMTVCLARRDTNRVVEVDLAVYRRCRIGQEKYLLRFVDERELESYGH